MKVRPAAVAGSFYPADPRRLEAEVRGHLAAAAPPLGWRPKAVIAPHAGYVYSGPVAGSAFRQLAPGRGEIDRVVLIGPSHFVPFAGLALPVAEAFETPLGDVPVAADAAVHLASLPQVVPSDLPHEREHAEVDNLQSILLSLTQRTENLTEVSIRTDHLCLTFLCWVRVVKHSANEGEVPVQSSKGKIRSLTTLLSHDLDTPDIVRIPRHRSDLVRIPFAFADVETGSSHLMAHHLR